MKMWVKVLHSICNMDTSGPPDMRTPTPGPAAPGAHMPGRPPMPMLQILIVTLTKFFVQQNWGFKEICNFNSKFVKVM